MLPKIVALGSLQIFVLHHLPTPVIRVHRLTNQIMSINQVMVISTNTLYEFFNINTKIC